MESGHGESLWKSLRFLKINSRCTQLGIKNSKTILFRPNLSIISSNLSIFLKTKNSKQGKENDVKVRGGIATDRSDHDDEDVRVGRKEEGRSFCF